MFSVIGGIPSHHIILKVSTRAALQDLTPLAALLVWVSGACPLQTWLNPTGARWPS